MTENRIFCVTLAFNPPGPLTSSLLIAPDEAMASAMAMQSAMAIVPPHTSLAGVAVFAVDADVLRQMLRAVEGKGPGEVVSLVPKPQKMTATEVRTRQMGSCHCPAMVGEACPLTADECQARSERFERAGLVRPEQRAAEILRQHPETDAPVDRITVYGEQFGPPVPDSAA